MTQKHWIIEARNKDGSLNMNDPQPEQIFGNGAISGMTDWQMSRTIFNRKPDASLTGDSISVWPKLIDERFIARVKTW